MASWFNGIPSAGSKFLDAPKYLTHLLCHSRTCQSVRSSSLQPLLVTAQDSPRIASDFDHRSTSPNWVSTIEQLLLTPVTDDATHPLTGLLDSMQSLFGQMPIVAASNETQLPVAIVEVGNDGTSLSQTEPLLPKLGFWQCPTGQSNGSGGFQIWVKGCQVAIVRDRASAEVLTQRFRELLEIPNLDASTLKAVIEHNQPGAKLGDRTIFTVSDSLANRIGRPAELLAIEWMNNLRIALGQTSISLADAQTEMHHLEITNSNIDGMASWYGPYFHGRQTANGEIFNQNELTAAHPTLPLGTFLKVTNRLNGKSIVVRVNDRGPYFDNRVLDLSKRAAIQINSDERGIVPIEAVVMQPVMTAQIKQPPQQVARLVTGY